ncbi:MAG: ABC transporter permease [Bacillota bacterium]
MLSLNRQVWLKEWRENRWKSIAFGLVLMVNAVITAFFFDQMTRLLKDITLPKWAEGQLVTQMAAYSAYVWSNWFGKNLYQMATLFLVLYGISAMASEVSRGTSSFLLSKPVRRGTVLFSKWLASAVGFALVTVLSTLLLYPASLAAGHSYEIGRHLAALPMVIAAGLVVLSLSFVFSVVFDDPVKAGGGATLALLVLSLPSWFAKLRQWSLFYYLSAGPVAVDGSPHWGFVLLMLVLAGAVYAVAQRLLEEKDF